MMFPVNGGKDELNPAAVVWASKSKDGETWTVQLLDNKQVTITKGEYAELRELVSRAVRIVCHEDA